VSEFTHSSGNPDVADTTEHVLLTIPHPNQTNHNGGQLRFGPDGDLYISTGDGGGGNDTQGNGQRKDRLLGKILRIDPGQGSPYAIPSGNPFGGSLCNTGSNGGPTCPEIWAYGLRNPWRFSFDSASGDLVIGDVGQGRDEEIDYAHSGQNVGATTAGPATKRSSSTLRGRRQTAIHFRHPWSPRCSHTPTPATAGARPSAARRSLAAT
jgi:glucose/arabinose dehydrogenase